MKRYAFPVLIGIGGVAILLSLGTWQLQRLAWKQDLIAAIETRIAAEPIALPERLAPERDRYLPVTVTGSFPGDAHARMLASRRQVGAVYRHIAPFRTEDGSRILVDLGWTPATETQPQLPEGPLTLTGNLDWPRETDGFTPEPDLDAQLWYARDVEAMAEVLDTRPVLLVLRDRPGPGFGPTPWPVDTDRIPNDHLQYALTWFSLAVIWVGMTVLFVLRSRSKSRKG